MPLGLGNPVVGWRRYPPIRIEPEPADDDDWHDQHRDDSESDNHAHKAVEHPTHHQSNEETDGKTKASELEAILTGSDDQRRACIPVRAHPCGDHIVRIQYDLQIANMRSYRIADGHD